MRRILSLLSLTFILPLAACFDVDMSIAFPDDDSAEGTMVMTATPEFYAMMTSSGEAFCEGEETTLDDGRHSCTETFSGTIEEVLADPDLGEGMSIERRDGGLIYVAFDLGDLSEEVMPPEEQSAESEEMKQMMLAAFMGHKIAIHVSGGEIVETNGTLSEDGKTASFEIPLDMLVEQTAELPDSFEVLLEPGT